MSDTEPQDFLVRCTDCPKSEQITWLPWTVRERCEMCAQSTAARHLAEHPGHRCRVHPPISDENLKPWTKARRG